MRKPPFEYRITFIYLLVGVLWILFSDKLLSGLVTDAATLSFLQSIKGSFYVVATALLLWALVHNYTQKEKKSNVKLRESEQRYRSVFHDSKSVMLLIDNDSGLISDANKAALDYYGYSYNEIRNLKITDITVSSKENIDHGVDKILHGGQDCFNFRHRLKNGEIRDVKVYSGKIRMGDKPMLFSIIHDVTRQVEMEQELIKAKEKAEESDKLKTAFMANLSHEIRTPMNGIIGFSDLLRSPELTTENKHKYIDLVHTSGDYLLSIINDIVEISRLDTRQVKIDNESFNLAALCREVVNEMQLSLPDDRDINLYAEINISNGFNILSDKNKLSQILRNFITNAIKYTLSGDIYIGCRKSGHETLLFYVKDQGIGIEKRFQNKIFEPFRQANTSGEIFQKGSGLGLAISKSYADLMDGHIWVDSSPGQGSTFYLTIPYKSSEYPGKSIKEKTKLNKIKSGEKTKVLVAEDDDVNYKYIHEVLSSNNVEVIHARDGKEAIDAMAQMREFDLILMDIKMPVMDGYEALKKIKNQFPDIKVIAQTAYAMKNDEKDILNAGFDGYIAKPIKKEHLLEYFK